MITFKKLDQLVEAIKNGEIPSQVISPGAAAVALGITRQGVRDLCVRHTLPCWKAERVILIDADAVQRLCMKKRGVGEGQEDLL